MYVLSLLLLLAKKHTSRRKHHAGWDRETMGWYLLRVEEVDSHNGIEGDHHRSQHEDAPRPPHGPVSFGFVTLIFGISSASAEASKKPVLQTHKLLPALAFAAEEKKIAAVAAFTHNTSIGTSVLHA